VDNELSDHEKTQLEHHTHICPSCAAELQGYLAINRLLVPPEPIEASPWLWTRIRQRLSDSGEARRVSVFARLRPILIPVAGVAAVVIAVITAGQLTQTINVSSRNAAVETVNLQREDATTPVWNQSVVPDSAEDDTLEFQE